MPVGKFSVYLPVYKQGKMMKQRKKHAPVPGYVSPNQLDLEGFETPFEQALNPKNRWVTLANIIPWDEICNLY
ncbi:MAG: hypothetical protein B6I19_05865, partial [Bacteroidetes bacterium 4572_114]